MRSSTLFLALSLLFASAQSNSGLEFPKSYAAGGLRGSFRQVEGTARTLQGQERRVSTVMTEDAKLASSDIAPTDQFGLSVAIDGSTLVAGAYHHGSTSGAAYVFDCSGSSFSTCTEAIKLISPEARASEGFGYSVAISGLTIVVGSYYSAYIFECFGSPITTCTAISTLAASDAVAGDDFGRPVAISGSMVVVGAKHGNSGTGAAYVFHDCSTFPCTESDKLTATDAADGDWFGNSVAVSGSTVVVGSHNHVNLGAAYVFDCSSLPCSGPDKLTASDASAGAQFGYSVAISSSKIVVGALADPNSGAAYLFDCSSTCTQAQKLTASNALAGDFFGYSVTIDGSTIVVGALRGNSGTGSAYMFECSTVPCIETHQLIASDAAVEDHFGRSVAISGTTVVAGAPLDDDPGDNSGAAYIYFADADQDADQDGVPDSIDLCPNTTDIGDPVIDDNGCSEDQRTFSVSAPSFHFVVTCHAPQNLGLVCDTGYKQDLLRIAWDSYDPILYTNLPGIVPSVAGVYPIRVVVVVDGVEIDMSEEMQVVVYEDSDEDGSTDSSDSDDNESD